MVLQDSLEMQKADFFGNVNQLYRYFRQNLYLMYNSPMNRDLAMYVLIMKHFEYYRL